MTDTAQNDEQPSRLELLISSTARVMGDRNPTGLLHALIERLAETIDLDVYANFLLDDRTGRLHLAASGGFSEKGTAAVEWLDLGVAVCGTVAQTGRSMVVERVQQRTDEMTAFIRSEGVRAYACRPLTARGRVVGTLSMGTRRRDALGPEALVLMNSVCEQFEAALEYAEAEEERARQAHLLDMAHDAIIVWDLEGGISYWGPGAEALYGYRAEEVTGRLPHELLQLEVEGGIDALWASLRARGEWQGDLHHRAVDGRQLVVAGRLVLSKEGSREVILEINRDITELKRVEREFLRMAEVKDEFLGIVAHELRGPLTTVVGLARAFERRLADGAPLGKEDASTLRADAERLSTIVDDLLGLAQLDRQPLELEPVRLEQLLRRWLDSHQRRMPVRHLSLLVENEVPLVEAHPGWLKQVVDNLVQNADKYSPPDQPIEVIVRGQPDRPTVEVHDRGVGFVAEDVERLFERFYRADRGTASTPGLGLGLAICRRLIQLQGGEIWARPRPGGGSVFGFHLLAVGIEGEPG